MNSESGLQGRAARAASSSCPAPSCSSGDPDRWTIRAQSQSSFYVAACDRPTAGTVVQPILQVELRRVVQSRDESLGTLVPWVLSLRERRLGDSDTQGRPSDDEAGAGGSWAEQEEPRGLLAPGLWPPERGRMSSAPAPVACSPGGDTHPMSSPRSPQRSLQPPAPRSPPCWTVLDVSQSGPIAPLPLTTPPPPPVRLRWVPRTPDGEP
ncbi:unnamed protein product [Rangifer tarandus platyrhynchus]|uniref:Uncharacterized protein n=1 Tax=Rangifer tarandus platyrhynchus TaxID=3082113 RepID=A0ABN8ZHV5_RANTA|nr:unnamed protein product [Rangifer tarandus platyrhynchus]